eukprot:CAMPEP_0176030184 /NCGR_PEP_ID=MMETSP0120_2-20121206/14844_1 /TAXON_ID=160619 /ORGANISM="Kryptoperidinium foliaceum, Strain CCMP 1326" /LENGTH=949 /DNA_ID=CAMNT_0017363421 /DNA_START=182 /DNA_END=3031 /DNA_ORIENTATION=+
MTTRSSRFFVVLVHLLGVSTHIPSSGGIVGVNPLSVVLETLDPALLESDDSLDSGLLHGQPHWIQDVLGDQACLDPMGGFSECGDATLWFVIPKKSSKRQARWRQWITWATEEEETEENTSSNRIQGYALQLFDESHQESKGEKSQVSYPYLRQHSPTSNLSERECLTRRRKDNKLVLIPCSQDRAWAWHFNENGILYFKKPKGGSPVQRDLKQKRLLKKHGKKLECLGRSGTSPEALLMPCDGLEPTPENLNGSPSSLKERVLRIALVRQATADVSRKAVGQKGHVEEKLYARPPHDDTTSNESPLARKPPPSRIDIAHSHASATPRQQDRVELKTGGVRMATSLSATKATPSASKGTSTTDTLLPLNYFKYSNPIMFAHDHIGTPRQQGPRKTTEGSHVVTKMKQKSDLAEGNTNTKMSPQVRKIQINPYISESINEEWTDPQTNLVFRTDLCRYLGHDRAEVGRHTLTGVGQFMKTVFNIKVYGVAFYVSKRDILADPIMERFASMSTDELRGSSDFYETLRFMTPSDNALAGTFDRTLFLKTNMQLATDTMRSSLDADWKMLTQADKDLLIGSSMKARPASEAMMAAIQSSENPSKCSCAQIAPDNVGADPSCCARGTELVFTWRKSGALEVRLNGDLMDSFDRPDIAAAIFYEYLRLDDPMSSDFLERVVDGFPMLLGPLSQVKGVSSPSMSHSSTSSSKTSIGPNPFARALDGVGGAVISGASNVAGLVQHGAAEIGNGAAAAARSMGDAARNLGEEIEQRRQLIGKHVGHFAHQTLSTIYSGGKDQKAVASLPKWLETMPMSAPIRPNVSENADEKVRDAEKISWISKIIGVSDGSSVGPSAQDEIVPMIHPSGNSTQRLFLGMVHLYLLLILIVSFPANLTTRTKLVVTRKSSIAQPVSDSDSDEGSSIESSNNPQKSIRKSSRGFSSFGIRQGSRMQNSL